MVQKMILVDVGTWTTGLHGRLSSLDPLGIEYLGAMLDKNGYNVKLIQRRGSLKSLVNEVSKNVINTDIIGISSLTCDINKAFTIAKLAKQKNGKIKVVIGGYHASALPHEVLKNDYVDFVILGEGENVLLDLMNELDSGNNRFENIYNLGWKNGHGKIKINPRNFNQFTNTSGLSIWPLREKRFFEGNKMHGVIYPPMSQHKAGLITYSRNCPYQCSYCASPWLYGRQVRHRHAQDVVNEMIHLKNIYGVNLFFFTDLTFNVNKTKVKELCDLMRGKKLFWYAMCSIDSKNIDEELISLMKEAGMTRILFGLESFSKIILKAYNRKIVEKRTNYLRDLLRLTDKYGIASRCTYMIGEINETEDDLKTYLNLFKQILPDEMSIKLITPFPGTPLFHDYEREGILLHKQWNKYDIEHLVFKHPSLSEEIFKKYQYEITKQYFESDEYRRHVSQKIRRHPHLRQSFFDYFDKIKTKEINIKL